MTFASRIKVKITNVVETHTRDRRDVIREKDENQSDTEVESRDSWGKRVTMLRARVGL